MKHIIVMMILTAFIWANYSNPLVQKRFKAVQSTIKLASKKHNVPYKLLKSMLYIESRFDPKAISPNGPIGISQFTLNTAKIYNVDRLDVKSSINGMAKAVRHEFNNTSEEFTTLERWKMASYIYNQGKGSYWLNKKRVVSKGYKPTYQNIMLQIAIYGKNNEGLLYVENIKI